MPPIWINESVFGYTVEQDEIKRPGGKSYITMPPTGKGVLHTTEGWSLDVALDTLHAKFAAPHFVIGEDTIVQSRPLGVQSAALIDPGNRLATVQIECCGFTGGSEDWTHHAMDSWQFIDSTFKPLAALMAYLSVKNIIPLERANNYPDDCSDILGIWATTRNTRRLRGAYNKPEVKGWHYHLEVPNNNHYDCGRLRFAELLAAAQGHLNGTGDAPTISPVTPTPVESAPTIHTVVAGESFYGIARQYNVNPLVLAKRNNMTLASLLMPGQLLTIPQ